MQSPQWSHRAARCYGLTARSRGVFSTTRGTKGPCSCVMVRHTRTPSPVPPCRGPVAEREPFQVRLPHLGLYGPGTCTVLRSWLLTNANASPPTSTRAEARAHPTHPRRSAYPIRLMMMAPRVRYTYSPDGRLAARIPDNLVPAARVPDRLVHPWCSRRKRGGGEPAPYLLPWNGRRRVI